MKPIARLGLYGLLIAGVFTLALVVARAVVPPDVVQSWEQRASSSDHPGDSHSDDASASSLGLSSESGGYLLNNVSAPASANTKGTLKFTITGPDGQALQDYKVKHEKELHLIVVRSDGQHFRHVHPQRDGDGTWSTAWDWATGGTYRAFVDFVPAATNSGITLSSNVEVAGKFEPVTPQPTTKTTVDGYTVATDGKLTAEQSSKVTFALSHDGKPVTNVEPYLGAFGHLVVLRSTDLAYLHAHPVGTDPQPGQTTGPYIDFEVTTPTAGTYLLYLDFKVDGRVHTAPLVLVASPATATATKGHSPDETPAHEDGSEHEHH